MTATITVTKRIFSTLHFPKIGPLQQRLPLLLRDQGRLLQARMTTTTTSNTAPSKDITTTTTPTMIVYSIAGSQFTAKVLAALQQRQIPHYVQNVPLDKEKRKRVIPSGGYLVPELKILQSNGTDLPVIVSDSEKILHYIDDHYGDKMATKLYPGNDAALASGLSVRASDGKLAGFVWYYNWVHDASYAASIRTAVRRSLPWWLNPILPHWLVDSQLQGERTKFRQQAAQAMLGQDAEDDAALDDEPKMRAMLVQELQFFQSHLKQPTAQQPFLIAGTMEPTAADFSVYPQLERLVGGDTVDGDGHKVQSPYDVGLPPALPQLLENKTLTRLWEWHQHMQKTCPVQFKGKKPPADLST